MKTVEKLVETYFKSDYEEFLKRKQGEFITTLSLHEKVLVYKYTKDYYEDLNEALRDGKEPESAQYLNEVLRKLPDYRDLVFRGTELSEAKKEHFRLRLESGELYTEPAFFSATKSELIANEFSRGDTIFTSMENMEKTWKIWHFTVLPRQ